MNRFDFIGNIGHDLELRYTAGTGRPVMGVSLANTRVYKKRGAEDRTEKTTWLQVTLFDRQAEDAAKYLGKGSKVRVSGRIENDNYETEGGMRYGYAFITTEVEYLSPAKGGGQPPADDDEGGDPVSHAKSGSGSAPRASGKAAEGGQ